MTWWQVVCEALCLDATTQDQKKNSMMLMSGGLAGGSLGTCHESKRLVMVDDERCLADQQARPWPWVKTVLRKGLRRRFSSSASDLTRKWGQGHAQWSGKRPQAMTWGVSKAEGRVG
jgi:hypothetical protein